MNFAGTGQGALQRARVTRSLSVVVPCYNEADGLDELYRRVTAICDDTIGSDYEIVLVNDGSRDATWTIMSLLVANDDRVVAINLTRNYGHQIALTAGLEHCCGERIFILDADLQDPPELLPEFLKYWEGGYEIVYGIRATREEGWLMRNLRQAYYRVLTRFSEVSVPPGVGDFQLVDRRVVEAMRQVTDNYPFMRMMTFECGGRAIGIPYTWRARKKGVSKNRLAALLDQALNGLVSFTNAPLRLGLVIGFIISGLSILYAVANFVLGLVMYRRVTEPGIMTLIVALFFFGGVQLFFMGMIGEYILAIYGQVRGKPVVFERERINFDAPPPPEACSAQPRREPAKERV
jgi:polyisoprenyl-phosphate glycosyltransferase